MYDMKIAFFCGSLARGGSERVSLELAKYFLHEKAITTSIITIRYDNNEYELPDGIQRFSLSDSKNVNTYFEKLSFPKKIVKLRKIINQEKIDCMIVMGVPFCIYCIPACFGININLIVSERNDPTHFSGKTIVKICSRNLMKYADGFVFQTQDAFNFYSKVAHEKAVVIPNPVFTNENCIVGDKGNGQYFVNVGRLIEQKNQKLLIDAFSIIAKRFADYQLYIIGEGKLKESLQEKISFLGLDKRILLLGAKKTEELLFIIRNSRGFILSSNFEGVPNALIEAMSLGIPCISTDCPCGGPKSLIETGKNGVLVTVGDCLSLSNAMEFLIQNPKQASMMGKEAEKIKQLLSIEVIGRRWFEFIDYIYKFKENKSNA
ncbi:glycosyltransferase family 4 protein [bacterium D16-54]|nr:glycosyltransferase family 4 protein [bacterium D16-54]RKJ13428.1 glycosyltransferase family 4 protein [bacterium D16-56]